MNSKFSSLLKELTTPFSKCKQYYVTAMKEYISKTNLIGDAFEYGNALTECQCRVFEELKFRNE